MDWKQWTSERAAEQAEVTYQDYLKIKGFEDVGYFLIAYVVSGGGVTKNVSRNDTVDVTDIVVSLNNDIMARSGTTFRSKINNTTYYLDFTKDGDWEWNTSHASGVVGTDYLTIATVTTDNNKNINTITDTRGPIGGLRLKSDYGLEDYATKAQLAEIATGAINDNRSLKRWRSKLARVVSGVINQKANFVIIGDSITEGAWAGGGAGQGDSVFKWATHGYVRRIQNKMISDYGDAGMGFVPSYYQKEFSPMWSFTGTWEYIFGYGGIGGKTLTTTISGDKATFTFNGTGVRVIYTKHMFAGTFTYSVDGSAPVSVNSNSPVMVTGVTLDITGLTQGDHTLVLTNTGSDKLLLTGAAPIKDHSGVIVHQCGLNGATTGDHATDTSLNCTINALQPDLTVIALGCNDYGTQMPIVIYKANLQKIVNRALLYGDVVLISVGLSAFVGAIPQSEYVKAMHDVAQTNNVVYLDLSGRWGDSAVYALNTLGFLSPDAVHPNDFGHQDIASFILANTRLA